MSDSRTAIIDAAERRMRLSGYHGFSFRDVASEVGIKSASVHYHFPTKEALGVAIGVRYKELFLAQLGDPEDKRVLTVKLALLRQLFRAALVEQGLMCLCGVLATEIASLPPLVAATAAEFFRALRTWLEGSFATAAISNPAVAATQTLAILEGALILARGEGNVGLFDTASELILGEQTFT